MKNKKTKDLAIFALFVFPAVVFVLFATDIPFVMNLYYSVFNWNGIGKNMEFVGLANYVKIFTADPLFWKGVRFTLKFAVFYVVIVNIVSLTVAIVMARENKVNSLGRAFYYIPYIISLTAISLIWKFILGPSFEALYSVTGWEFFNWSWLGTPKLAFYVVVVMAVWQNLGFTWSIISQESLQFRESFWKRQESTEQPLSRSFARSQFRESCCDLDLYADINDICV